MKNKPANPLECIIFIIVLLKLYQLFDSATNKLFDKDFGAIMIDVIIWLAVIWIFVSPFLPWDKWRENNNKYNIYKKSKKGKKGEE